MPISVARTTPFGSHDVFAPPLKNCPKRIYLIVQMRALHMPTFKRLYIYIYINVYVYMCTCVYVFMHMQMHILWCALLAYRSRDVQALRTNKLKPFFPGLIRSTYVYIYMAMRQNLVPKWNPDKWKQGLKAAVPWWFNFDPYIYIYIYGVLGLSLSRLDLPARPGPVGLPKVRRVVGELEEAVGPAGAFLRLSENNHGQAFKAPDSKDPVRRFPLRVRNTFGTKVPAMMS